MEESQKYGRIPEVWKNPINMDESQKYGRISELWMNLESTDEPRKMGDFENSNGFEKADALII